MNQEESGVCRGVMQTTVLCTGVISVRSSRTWLLRRRTRRHVAGMVALLPSVQSKSL